MVRRRLVIRTLPFVIACCVLSMGVARPVLAQVPPASQQLTVTLAGNNSTIRIQPGDRFLLNLGEDYTWGPVEFSDSAVAGRVVGITVIRGAQGVFEGRAVGTTTLTTSGDPACRQSNPPCASPSLAFRMTIVVGSPTSATPTATTSATTLPSAATTAAAPRPPATGSGLGANSRDGLLAAAGFAALAVCASGVLLLLVMREGPGRR